MNNTEYWARQERRWIERSGIPKRFWHKTFEDLTITKRNRRAIEQVQEYLEKDTVIDRFRQGVGLWLLGEPGSGKTTVASIAAIECARHGARTWFMKMADWQDALHAQYKDVLTEDERVMNHRRLERVKTAKLLVLDDVGKEYGGSGTGHIEGSLEALLRGRYDKAKPTFVTTNLTPAEWAERYGEPMESFLYEAFVLVTLTGDDWRRSGG